MKIRIGNDFKIKWAITWMGEPEDFSDATDISLFFNIYDKKIELARDVDYTITDNIIEIDCTPDICNILGVYNLELHYTKPSDGFIDGERRSAVDIDAFRIVDKSDKADAIDEISSVSESALGFQGLSAYEVWLKGNPGKTKEDYFNWLQKPATDIAETVNLQEQARVDAEIVREQQEQDRQTNTATAITNAETATENANTAAQNANDARLAIEGELALKANQTELDQLAGEVSVNIKNEISNGSFEGTISGWVPSYFNTPRTEFAKSGQQSAGIVFAGGSTTTQYGYTEVQTTIGDVYYAKAWAYIITFSSNQYLRKSNGGGFSGSIMANFNIDLLNQWQPVSLMFNAETSYTRIILGNTSTATDDVIIYYDDVQLFNLSSVFGHGNEPTLAEFELLLQMMGVEFFEGEITIQQRYLMRWQLALIRKNKNAIIALGGTII